MTSKYKKTYVLARILSAIMVIVPLFIYAIIGFVQGSIRSKLVLGMCLIVAAIFVIINIIAKHRIRSTIWLVLIGIYSACNNIVPLLIIIAVTTILDEFVFEPIYKKYKAKYEINKEIDARSEEHGE